MTIDFLTHAREVPADIRNRRRLRPVAEILKICQAWSMKPTAEQVASDWINYARYDSGTAPEDVFARGWIMYDLVEDDPALAWHAIKAVINCFTQEDLFSDINPEARRVVGNMAAGPLEDLLSSHGPQFIESVEAEARQNRRMAWALGGVWQSTMSDEIWTRVRRAAGDISFWRDASYN